MSLLSLTDVHSFYGHIHALKGISLTVEEGEIVTLIGSNGAGKSTTLRTVSGLMHPGSGRVEFDGRDISRMEPHAIVAAGLGHVPEGRGIFPTLTVRENLEMGAFTVRDPEAVRERMAYGFELFPRLKERIDQHGGTLSGGEQQMLAIARGLMMQPRLLMLDEPSMGLAPVLVELIFDIVTMLNDKGVTILLVEQNALMALSVAHRGYVLQNGELVLNDTAANLRRDPLVRTAYLGMA
ncbi:ABC transporter ATP-binding protein [Desulfobulbus elongatus]|uniref:ABC transporter ATP-binding protein n=1 Tax=Desulfobulbus elongatus TaxID=53332 RepID=UPI000488DA84|nr:ABC transporter ATP-binding protein [Desulfobulbus elongatus]